MQRVGHAEAAIVSNRSHSWSPLDQLCYDTVKSKWVVTKISLLLRQVGSVPVARGLWPLGDSAGCP